MNWDTVYLKLKDPENQFSKSASYFEQLSSTSPQKVQLNNLAYFRREISAFVFLSSEGKAQSFFKNPFSNHDLAAFESQSWQL